MMRRGAAPNGGSRIAARCLWENSNVPKVPSLHEYDTQHPAPPFSGERSPGVPILEVRYASRKYVLVGCCAKSVDLEKRRLAGPSVGRGAGRAGRHVAGLRPAQPGRPSSPSTLPRIGRFPSINLPMMRCLRKANRTRSAPRRTCLSCNTESLPRPSTRPNSTRRSPGSRPAAAPRTSPQPPCRSAPQAQTPRLPYALK